MKLGQPFKPTIREMATPVGWSPQLFCRFIRPASRAMSHSSQGIVCRSHEALNSCHQNVKFCREIVKLSHVALNFCREAIKTSQVLVNFCHVVVNSSREIVNSSHEAINSCHEVVKSSREALNFSHETLNFCQVTLYSAIYTETAGLPLRAGQMRPCR